MDGEEQPRARSLVTYLGNVKDTTVDVIMSMENKSWRFGFYVQMDVVGKEHGESRGGNCEVCRLHVGD